MRTNRWSAICSGSTGPQDATKRGGASPVAESGRSPQVQRPRNARGLCSLSSPDDSADGVFIARWQQLFGEGGFALFWQQAGRGLCSSLPSEDAFFEQQEGAAFSWLFPD